MNRIIDSLVGYGINKAEVMARFVDDEDLYVACFLSFVNDACFGGLRHALDCRDYETAFQHAHTLKGVSANLGLTPLYQSICAIVESLRNHDYEHLEQQHQAICRERDVLLKISAADAPSSP